jgi:hypothetical protein
MPGSSLRHVGRPPRSGRDASRFGDTEIAEQGLLGHSQVQEVAFQQLEQLGMITTADFDEQRSNYALKSDLTAALAPYMARTQYGTQVVQLDETGKIPRPIFSRTFLTKGAKVFTGSFERQSINGNITRTLDTINIGTPQEECYLLPFCSLWYGGTAIINPATVEVRTSTNVVVGRGEAMEMGSNPDANSGSITVMPTPSIPLPPGTEYLVNFVYTNGANPAFAATIRPAQWCVIQIPRTPPS